MEDQRSESSTKPNTCISCRGFKQYGELKDAQYCQPSPTEPHHQVLRGWMCEDCRIVHWAWEV